MQTSKQDSTRPPQPSDQPTASRTSPRPSTSSPPSRNSPVRESAFSAHFLDVARRRHGALGLADSLAESPLSVAAHAAGPWDVDRVPAGDGVVYAVVRRSEPARDGGGARLAFIRRQEALLAAAALSALAVPDRLSLNADKRSGRRSRLGFPLHDGGEHLGHASPSLVAELADISTPSRRPGDPFLGVYQGYRALASTPAAAALFVEALDPETLALLGREIMRRLGSRA